MIIYLKNKYQIELTDWKLFLILSIGSLLFFYFETVRNFPLIVNILQILSFLFCVYFGNSMLRISAIFNSNNYDNPNKNICMLAVFEYLELEGKVKYLHTTLDAIQLANSKYVVVEIPNDYVGNILQLKGLYLTFVENHVLLIEDGDVIVDTASTPVMQKTVNVYKLLNKI